jgi:hypothetical protein
VTSHAVAVALQGALCRWNLLRLGHMGLVSEIETALRGTGLDPAQVMAAADLNRMPIKTAVGLLKVPQLLAELASAVGCNGRGVPKKPVAAV